MKIVKQEVVTYRPDGEIYPRIRLIVRVVEDDDGEKYTQLVDDTGWDGFNEIEPVVIMETTSTEAFSRFCAIAHLWVEDVEYDTYTPIVLRASDGVPYGVYIYNRQRELAIVENGEHYLDVSLPTSALAPPYPDQHGGYKTYNGYKVYKISPSWLGTIVARAWKKGLF